MRPTTTRSPDSTSIASWYAESDSCVANQPDSMQASAPPRCSMSSSWAEIRLSTSSVSASTAYEPASGSTVSVSPDSKATTCWVRSANVAAASVGTPSASSYADTCSVCTPESAATVASIEARTMLLSGCCAANVDPAVNAKMRSCCDRGSSAPYRSFSSRAHTRRAARNFATSGRKSIVTDRKVNSVGATWSTETPRRTTSSRYARALANVNAISCSAKAPDSRMW